MKMSLSNICAVIDIDGFNTSSAFYVRELGYASLTKGYNESFRFKLNHLAKELTSKDWKSVTYCTRFIHGLKFCNHPDEKDLHQVETLKQLIQCVYNENKTEEKYLIAYKGGYIERKLLDELNISSVNLEHFGCPKFEYLQPTDINDCGYHIHCVNPVHCAKVECYAFVNWIKFNLM